jgi:transposase InsO family protein
MLVSLGRTLAYPLEVIGPDGKPARLTEVGKRVLETRRRDSSHRIVHDGYTEDFQIRADYFYDMREPGEYKLRVSREVPSKADPRKTVRIYSNVVKIRIEGPQDKE